MTQIIKNAVWILLLLWLHCTEWSIWIQFNLHSSNIKGCDWWRWSCVFFLLDNDIFPARFFLFFRFHSSKDSFPLLLLLLPVLPTHPRVSSGLEVSKNLLWKKPFGWNNTTCTPSLESLDEPLPSICSDKTWRNWKDPNLVRSICGQN